MLFCPAPELESWSPDFSSSECPNPTWMRLRKGRTELCNSLEWTDWSTNPVQVQLCDACGCVGCAAGGYVHVSTLHGFVIWTMPQLPDQVELAEARCFPATALKVLGAIGFPDDTWASIRASVPDVPAASTFPQANGRALAEAWALGPDRPTKLRDLLPMLRARLLGADTLEVGAAIHWVQHWLDWFSNVADSTVAGTIGAPEVHDGQIETFYFDGPSKEDWPALARHGEMYVPVLDRDHVFLPAL